jgi:hypothetical protein
MDGSTHRAAATLPLITFLDQSNGTGGSCSGSPRSNTPAATRPQQLDILRHMPVEQVVTHDRTAQVELILRIAEITCLDPPSQRSALILDRIDEHQYVVGGCQRAPVVVLHRCRHRQREILALERIRPHRRMIDEHLGDSECASLEAVALKVLWVAGTD